ncbi:MAG TPA: 3-oxoacyl-ACP reductase FabG [Clostridia bacterium]|jgi:3-oxoacyl-[acyl-carrier protein] reductase|nr:3-oxoacyl-ACP reductase FabG [Clostridia bacterium]
MKSVLITGGAVGIGRGLVTCFANNGYNVMFTYRAHKDEAEELAKQTNSRAFYCDITNMKHIRTLHEKVGGVDILINNAGVSDIRMCTDIDELYWDYVINTNLKGTFLLTQSFIPNMVSNKFGRIINIGSMWGFFGSACEVHYAASKAGLIGITKSLAKELGPSGITVNLIAPGVIDTNMNKNIDSSALQSIIEDCPISRMGTPEDVAYCAAFLASDEASYITGAVIPIDGGYTA